MRQVEINTVKMIRTLCILFLVATSAYGLWEKGLRATYGINPFNVGTSTYTSLPETVEAANEAGWINVTRPDVPTGYESLFLMCPNTSYILCCYFDDTGYIGGYQVALNIEKLSNIVYDWATCGMKKWIATENNVSSTFYVSTNFFMDPDFLAKDSATRIANRDSSVILQDSSIRLSGFNGNLVEVPTSATALANDSPFTEQGCFVGMGKHFYYNMTTSLTCSAETILTWFQMIYNNQTVGTGFMLPGKYTASSDEKERLEAPTKAAIKIIVPKGPDCLSNYADETGMMTLHVFYVKDANLISCIW